MARIVTFLTMVALAATLSCRAASADEPLSSHPILQRLQLAANSPAFDACVTAQNCGGGYQGCIARCIARSSIDDEEHRSSCSAECSPALDRCLDKARRECANK
jgi:hypothetical protein